jgi:hypothetical protein
MTQFDSSWKGKSEGQDSVRIFTRAKYVRSALLKTKAFIEFDRMIVGFVDLKPDCFRVLLPGKRQHVLH